MKRAGRAILCALGLHASSEEVVVKSTVVGEPWGRERYIDAVLLRSYCWRCGRTTEFAIADHDEGHVIVEEVAEA